jgi:hypothetical protein
MFKSPSLILYKETRTSGWSKSEHRMHRVAKVPGPGSGEEEKNVTEKHTKNTLSERGKPEQVSVLGAFRPKWSP